MATYIQGDNPYVTDITPWSPDFSMMQRTLGQRQQRYSQGFERLQGMYNSMLNAQLTSEDNQVAREGYLKQAQDALNSIKGQDFSIQKNVASAETIFDPFYEDKEIVADMVTTQKNIKALTTAHSFRDSKDKAIRDQYNPIAEKYIMNGMDQLRTAKRGTGEIQSVQPRSFVPFQDVSADLFKAAKDAGYEIEYTQQNGAYMVKVKNGPNAYKGFYSFAKEVMGNKYDEQFRVTATVAYEDDVKNIKRNNPLLDDKGVREEYAKLTALRYKSAAENSVKLYENDIADVDAQIKKIKEEQIKLQGTTDIEFDAGSPVAQRLSQLAQKRELMNGQLNAAKENATNYGTQTSEAYTKLVKDVADDPVRFNHNYIKETSAANWAKVASSASKEEWKIDEVFKMDWEDKWKKLEYEQKERLQQFNMNMRAVDYNGDGLPDNGTPDKVQIGTDVNGNAIYGTATAAGAGSVGAGASGKLSQNDKDKTTVNGGHLLGASATFPIKREKKEILEEYKNSLSGVISNGIYSDTGVAAVLRSLPGVTHTDVTRAINRMQNFNLGTASRSSKDEIDSYQKVIDGLRKEGIDIPAYHGAVGARNAILAYTAKYFDSKLKDPAYKFTDDDAQVARNYIAAKEAMSELDHLNSLQTQQRDKLLAQDKYKVLRRADGTMIDPDEKVSADLIRKEIGNDSRIQFALGNKSNGSYHNYDLSGNELAEAFKNGKFKVLGKGNFEFNGQVVRLADYAYADVDTNAKANPAAANTKKILTRLHEIESGAQRDKYKALIDEVDDQVSEAVLPKHMDNGEMGWTISYKTSNKWSDERGQLLAEEILQPGNRGKVYYADGRINTKTGLINDLSKLSGEELEKVIGENVNYLTKGPGGKPAIQLTISSSLPEKHPFKSSAGETLIFEIDSTKSGKALKQLTQSSDLYIYGKLLRGEELHEDPVMKASGFSYSAIPTRDGRNVTINMDKRTYVLDKDGKGTWEPKTQSFTVSLDQMNPDEIGTMLSQAFIQHVDYNAQQQKLEAEKAKRAGTVDANGQPVKKLKWSDLIK